MPNHHRSRRPRRANAVLANSDAANPAASASPPADTQSVFAARLQAGDLDGILGARLRRTLRDVAADTSPEWEVGILRLILVRLLKEEHDLARLATSAARIAAVAVQASRLRHDPDDDENSVRAIFLRQLAIVEAEDAERKRLQTTTPTPLPSGTDPW